MKSKKIKRGLSILVHYRIRFLSTTFLLLTFELIQQQHCIKKKAVPNRTAKINFLKNYQAFLATPFFTASKAVASPSIVVILFPFPS